MVGAGGTGPGQGFWSPVSAGFSITRLGEFSPSVVGTFQVRFTWYDQNTCEKDTIVRISVNEPTQVRAGADRNVCLDSISFTLAGFTPGGGIWSGPGMLGGMDSTFNPRQAGVGTHALIYALGSGLCRRIDTLLITVNPLPNVNAGPDQDTICIQDPNLILSTVPGVSPLGGFWSGTGITDASTGAFSPVSAGVGVHTITYTFRDTRGCDSSDTKRITVNALPAVWARDTSFCRTTNGTSVSLAGAGGSGSGTGQWTSNTSGFRINADGTFVPDQIGTFQARFTWRDRNTCWKDTIIRIRVTEPEQVRTGADLSLCIDSTGFALTGFSPRGGLWSGPGMIGGMDSAFLPRRAGVGLHPLIYTLGSGLCERKDTLLLTVLPLPNVSAGPDQDTVCINDAPIQLATVNGVIPTGGRWSGPGISNANSGTFNPSVAGIGTHTVTYSYRDARGCDSSDTKRIVVNPLPRVWARDTAFCRSTSGEIVRLVGAGGTGNGRGSWSAVSAGISITPQGEFVPTIVGTYQVRFSWHDENTCGRDTLIRVVVTEPAPVRAGSGGQVCIDSTGFVLQGFSPRGGVWQGPGLVGGTDSAFFPRLAGLGTHQIVYTFGSGLCLRRDTTTVLVRPLPDVSAGADQDTVCIQDPPILLSALGNVVPSTGGRWSGPGITNEVSGTFSPMAAGVGSHTITYIYKDPFGCDSAATKRIRVNDLPQVWARDTSFCRSLAGDVVRLSNAGGSGTGAGYWTSLSPTFAVSPQGHVTPNTIGIYRARFTWKDQNTCERDTIITVRVTEPETVLAGPDYVLCIDSLGFALSGFTPKAGVWSGPGLAGSQDSTFNPRQAGAGQHTLAYTVGEGLCLRRDTVLLTVNPLPSVNAGPSQDTICVKDAPFDLNQLPGVEPVNQGIWFVSSGGPTSLVSASGIFNPAQVTGGIGISAPSTIQVGHSFRDRAGCDSVHYKTVVVNPMPRPAFTVESPALYCVGRPYTFINRTPSLAGSPTLQYFWDYGNGNLVAPTSGIDGAITFSDTGYKRITLWAISTKGCRDSVSQLIHVVQPVVPSFSKRPSNPRYCGPVQVLFNNTSVGLSNAYYWDFGLNGIGYQLQPVSATDSFFIHTYPSSRFRDSVFVVRLKVENLCDTTEFVDTIRVKPSPTAIFIAPLSLICSAPHKETLYNYSIGQPDRFIWSFGDGTPDTTTFPLSGVQMGNVRHGFVNNSPRDTVFIVRLTAINACDTSIQEQQVRVRAKSVFARYNLALNRGCAPLALRFTSNQVQGNGNQITWDFGDGFTASGGTIQDHVYRRPGVYRALLTVQNGCEMDTVSQLITVNPRPRVEFSPSDTAICRGITLTMRNTSDTALAYRWLLNGVLVSSDRSPSLVFNVAGRHSLVLDAAIASTGCNNADTTWFTVSPHLATFAGMEAAPLEGCAPFRVRFRNTSRNGQGARVFFGNGLFTDLRPGTDTGSYLYRAPGLYRIKLAARGLCNHDTTDELIVSVTAPPTTDFVASTHLLPTTSADTVVICLDDTVRFINQSPNQPAVTYTWTFGDSTGSLLFNPPAHRYPRIGYYQVLLRARSESAPFCTSVTRKVVWVKPLPVASFTQSTQTLCPGSPITFSSTSRNAVSYKWVLQDNGRDTSIVTAGNSLQYAFAEPGPHRVRLVVYNSDSRQSCADSTQRIIVVLPKPRPQFTLSDSTGCAPLNVQIRYGLTSTPGDASQGTLSWDFGNGQTYQGFGPIPDQRYQNQTGQTLTHRITVRALAQGCRDSITKVVRVFPVPQGAFTIIPGDTIAQDSAFVTLVNQTRPLNQRFGYRWNFGDGRTRIIMGDTSRITHQYDTTGTFTVTLTPFDPASADSCGVPISRQITVLPVEPDTRFQIYTYEDSLLRRPMDSVVGCVPLRVRVRNLTRFGRRFFWDFGGSGHTSTVVQPGVITYDSAGDYTVRLISVNAIGRDTLEKRLVIRAFPKPIADFTVQPDSIYPLFEQSLRLVNLSRGATSYLWNFGDTRDTIVGFEPFYRYRREGQFAISMIAISRKGCRDTAVARRELNVIRAGIVDVPNAFTPRNDARPEADPLNDTFKPLLLAVKEYRIEIFDRWGRRVFESQDVNRHWDGTLNGQPSPAGVYAYKISIKTENGYEQTRTGDINLLR